MDKHELSQKIKLSGVHLTEKLLSGHRIIWAEFDGLNYHLLLENPDMKANQPANSHDQYDKKWLYYRTMNEIESPDFAHMISYGFQTRKSVLNKVLHEFYEQIRYCKMMHEKNRKGYEKYVSRY